MKKIIFIFSLVGGLAMPLVALADNANITFYGKINVDVESVKSDIVAKPEITPTSMTRVQSNSSRFGFKGSEDLGEGLQAIYQFEAQIDSVDDENSKTPFNDVRNSRIGLKGNFGTLFAGNWDTPYKTVHKKIEVFDKTKVFSTTNLAGVSDTGKSYNTRQNNVIQYWTPNVSDFTGQVSYALDSEKTATINQTSISLSTAYESDRLFAGLGYEKRADQTTTTKSDSAARLLGAFMFTDGQVGLMLERMAVANTLTTTATQRNIELAALYKISRNTLAVAYAKNGNYNGVPNTSAKQLALRYGYNHSKRTELYAAYTSLRNDTDADYGFYPKSATGSKQAALGFGMIHSF